MNWSRPISLEEAQHLPVWRRPVALLFVMAFAMPLAFATWSALLNNFVIEVSSFTGVEIGWLQTVREIPGFMAVTVLLVMLVMKEQRLALLSLVMLGGATIVTSNFPSFYGLLITTFIGSVGFHYFETVNQSLQLQWLDKDKAPQTLGWLVACGSAASLVAFGLITLFWQSFSLSYFFVYAAGGGACVFLALYAMIGFPQFQSRYKQRKTLLLRRRYWLYYALQFMAGARRQIFLVFAAFMMVEKFGYDVHHLTFLFLVNYLANMIFAPLMGRFVHKLGERFALMFEYAGLTVLFLLYGGIYYFDWGAWLAALLYVIDHLLFALAFALKTYFQKIADPEDIAPTAAVAFTINHIAAVFLPASLGYLWIVAPDGVYILAASMAFISLGLACLIPRRPEPGQETIFAYRRYQLQNS
ncbi:MAG: MFS transporter [Candidatus Puniceispirillaceae bacterium]